MAEIHRERAPIPAYIKCRGCGRVLCVEQGGREECCGFVYTLEVEAYLVIATQTEAPDAPR